MDFPVCPQCHQSVIDDDAKDCPFCGASMSGKPAPKPAPKAAGPKPAAAVAATKSSQAKPIAGKSPSSLASAAGKPTLPGDDFPFDIELTTGKAAVPALPNPTKQRTFKVVCPMCDTPGYLPPTAMGQEVRCANTKCVMPVFTAPNPNKKQETVAAPPPTPSKLPIVIGVLAVALISAAGGYYFLFIKQNGPKGLSDEAKQALKELGQNKNTKAKSGEDAVPVNKPIDKVPLETKATNAQLISTAFKLMDEACLMDTNQGQRNKPFCRQLTADAYAMNGDVKLAQKNLEALSTVGRDSLYYRISPNLEMYWNDLNSGKKKEAAGNLELAMADVSKIPQFGRARYEISSQLVAALVAASRSEDAFKLLETIRPEDPQDIEPQLAAKLLIALDGRVAPVSNQHSILPWNFPQHVGATASLINHGQSESALTWVTGLKDVDAKAECLAYWAEDFARKKVAKGDADSQDKVAEVVQPLSPELSARIWARVGYGRFHEKDPVGAAAAIKLAQGLLEKTPPPNQPPTMPDMKSTTRYKLPDETRVNTWLRSASAAGEIAFLQAQMPETIADAEKSLDLALAYVDAIAPSFAAAEKVYKESEETGPTGRIKAFKSLNPKMKDDAIRSLALNYKDALDRIHKASKKRFDVQHELLLNLCGAGVGLNQKIWIVVNSRATATEPDRKENFLTATLAGELIESLKGTAEAEAIKGAWGALNPKEPVPPRPIRSEFEEKLKKDPTSAVKYVESKLKNQMNQKNELYLEVASRMAMQNEHLKAFSFVRSIRDDIPKWDCYRVVSAIAAERGHAEEVLKLVTDSDKKSAKSSIPPTEKGAICWGMIAGLKSIKADPVTNP